MEETIKTANQLNTTALAYMGDAVWELCVRDHLISSGIVHVDKLHKSAVKYVAAPSQEAALRALMSGFLNEEEEALVKRARNHKLAASKKNSGKDAITDKYATAFEALIGWLYISEQNERMNEVVQAVFLIVEEKL